MPQRAGSWLEGAGSEGRAALERAELQELSNLFVSHACPSGQLQ